MSNEDKKREQAQKAEKRAAALRENLRRRKAAGDRDSAENTNKNKGQENDQRRDD